MNETSRMQLFHTGFTEMQIFQLGVPSMKILYQKPYDPVLSFFVDIPDEFGRICKATSFQDTVSLNFSLESTES